MSKLIDLIGLTNIANDIRSWVNAHFLRKEEVPAGSTPSTTTPKMDGVASVGTENAFARGDHRHPSDTSKVDKVDGKGLSTNDYDATAKAKVDAIPADPKYTDTVYDDTALAGRVSTIEGKESGWDAKQDALVSGTNIKTINNTSLLGSGNINIQGGGASAFIAEYGVTTYADVKAAYDEDAIIICTADDSGNTVVLQLAYFDDANDTFCFAQPVSEGSYWVSISSDDTWDDGYFQFASTDTATQLRNGLMSANDWQKLDGIESGAEVNVQSDWNQTTATADDYIKNKPTIPAAQIQSDWSQSDNTAKDFIKNKPTIPAAQVNADWNASSGVAQILNKPTIPTVPTKLSELTDDLGSSPTHTHSQYLTSHQSLSGYAKYVLCADEAAYNAISPKQSDTLYLIPES